MDLVLFILIAVTAALVGNSGGMSREEWIKQNCTKEAAFKMGTKDYKNGRDNNPQVFKNKCSQATLDVSLKGYTEGYAAAKKEKPTLHEHQSGQDLFEDVLHGINKNTKPKTED